MDLSSGNLKSTNFECFFFNLKLNRSKTTTDTVNITLDRRFPGTIYNLKKSRFGEKLAELDAGMGEISKRSQLHEKIRKYTIWQPSIKENCLYVYFLTITRVTRLGDFSPFGLLFEAHYDGNFLGYFLFKQIYYIFT